MAYLYAVPLLQLNGFTFDLNSNRQNGRCIRHSMSKKHMQEWDEAHLEVKVTKFLRDKDTIVNNTE